MHAHHSAPSPRPGAAAVLLACALLVGASLLLARWEDAGGARAVEEAFARAVPGAPGHPLWRLASAMGHGANVLFLVGCAFLASRRGDWLPAVLAALASGGAVGLVLKLALDRERPQGDEGLSWPSGHTLAAFTVVGVALARNPRALIAVAPAAAAVLLARVVVGRHFLSDVLAGAGVGTAMGFLVGRFLPPGPRFLSTVEARAVAGAVLFAAFWTRSGHGTRVQEFLSTAGGPLLVLALLAALLPRPGAPEGWKEAGRWA